MKKPMLNAIQKARMSMAMKSKNPKMNPGFDSLPKDVQAKIMNKRKPKLSLKRKKKIKPTVGPTRFTEARKRNVKVKPVNKEAVAKRKAITAEVRKKAEAKVSAEVRDRSKRIGGRSVMRDPLPPRMSKKNPKLVKGKTKKKSTISKEIKKAAGKTKRVLRKMKKAKASQTAGAIMKRERLMI